MLARFVPPVLLLSAAFGCWAQTAHRQGILILLPDPPGRPVSTAVLEGIQSEIHRADSTIAISTDFISQIRPDVPGFEATRLEWYKAKYRGVKFDAIVVFGPQAARALVPLHPQLWPDVPVVFCGVDPDTYQELSKLPNLTGVLTSTELAANLHIYLKLLPDTKRVALVGGASPGDRGFNSMVPGILRETTPSLELIDLTGLTLGELRTRVAALPDHTIVLIFSYLYDPAGRPMFVRDLVSGLAPVTNAPIFEGNDFSLGVGGVGGLLNHYSWHGAAAARLTLRVLHGEKASSIPVTHPTHSSLQFDWRELQRWKIPLDRLPSGSSVLFRPFSVWQRYFWWIVGIVAAGILESVLIAILLYERRRSRETELARKRAEEEARLIREEISHFNRIASMGELTASLAHELNQPLAGILTNAQAASRFLRRDEPDLAEVRAALEDIESDDIRAGEVIRKMRKMLKKGDSPTTLLDLNTIAAEAVALLHSDVRMRGMTLVLEQASGLPPVLADAVQLQQVIMNLVLNAMDAVQDRKGAEERRIVVETGAGSDGASATLSVTDCGPGIAPDLLDRVFQPFFSTKREGLGMGLSISRSIVEAHGGRIWAESQGAAGAVFRFSLPGVRNAVAAGGPAA